MPVSGCLTSSVPFQKRCVHVLRLLQGLLSLVEGQVTVFTLWGSALFRLIVTLHASPISSSLNHDHVVILFWKVDSRCRGNPIVSSRPEITASESWLLPSDAVACLRVVFVPPNPSPFSRGLLAKYKQACAPEVRQRS